MPHRAVTPIPRRTTAGIGAVALAALCLTACGSSSGSDADPNAAKVTITLTSGTCTPEPASVAAGPVTFKVMNKDAGALTEAELQRDGHIMGEKENLTPGLSGSFSLRLDGGDYQVYCPGGKPDRNAFTVTGALAPSTLSPDLQAAVTGYHDYVVSQVDQLVTAVAGFTAAVKSGDIAQAKQLFAPARTYYESVEPVAESFTDLDPAIDARVNDVDNPADWTGFHRIEKALWEDNNVSDMGPIADKLVSDVAKLQSLVSEATYEPEQIANGAMELLDEVGKSKVTGEEDRYSHTDLWDFVANVAGSEKAFDLLKPALAGVDPDLANTISQRFADLDKALATYKSGDGYVSYDTVGDADRKALTQKVDAVAEPLSKVASKVSTSR